MGKEKTYSVVNNQIFTRQPGLILPAAAWWLCLAAAVLLDAWALAVIPFALLLFYVEPRVVFFLLVISIPFSFEYNFSPALGTDVPDEALMWMVSFLFFGWLLYRPASLPGDAWSHPLVLLVVVHVCWAAFSSIFSTYPILSIKYLLAKSWYLGAFVLAPLMLFSKKRNIIITAALLSVGMLALSIIALFRHSLTGFSFTSINAAVAPFFRNHVTYSSLLVCVIPVGAGFYYMEKNRKRRAMLIAAIGILLIALLFSYARGAWLALAAGVFTCWLIRKRRVITAFVAALILCLLAIGWLRSNDNYLRFAHDYRTTIFHEDFSQHLVATYKLRDVSTAERFYRWVAAARMVGDKPLAGFGPNTFYENYKPYAIPAYKTWVSDNPEHSTVHNYFLLVLVEQGIPGLIFFLLLCAVLLYYAQAIYHRSGSGFYRVMAMVAGIVLVMIITINMLSDLIETDKIGSLFFLCMAALVMADRQTRSGSQPPAHVEGIP